MIKALTTTLAIGALSFTIAPSFDSHLDKWEVDYDHTRIEFSATHLMISEVEGDFENFTIESTVNKPSFEDSKFKVNIQAASINTGSKNRDKHLRSGDFLDIAAHPEITFESTSFKWSGESEFKMKGYFTINGVKKLETFSVKYNGSVIDPTDNLEKAAFKIVGKINRYDYDLKWDLSSDVAEAFSVGEEIELECHLRLKRSADYASNSIN
jgi:polyisoprenoid-binding protein YceI